MFRWQPALENTRARLLAERTVDGHWEGELSSSALSTATAVIAIASCIDSMGLPQQSRCRELVERGLAWLVLHQNADGGWGDTTISHSNISTTALVWAALSIATQRPSPYRTSSLVGPPFSDRVDEERKDREDDSAKTSFLNAEVRCETWLIKQAGSLDPHDLARTIAARYGRDRTFSVPILTALVLTRRLGDERIAWSLIPQLPFELAAFPHQFFAALQLPVVSYALPALIAMGQVRHKKRPTWIFFRAWLRNACWYRAHRVLSNIQPSTGGFLEATPLTSFVIMALVAAGSEPREVIEKGIAFLINSARADGSWPIDTSLSTWTTTLSIHALNRDVLFEKTTIESLRSWLLTQQYQTEHPYTHAKPGGWAWINLSGGVPDADDTSGALLALKKLGGSADIHAASNGITWLLDLQNRDGGIPTFCRGWLSLPFDRSSCDITAHAIRAWLEWYDFVDSNQQSRIDQAIRKAIRFFAKERQPRGTWAPLWFGNQDSQPEENIAYGTSRVVLALVEIERRGLGNRSPDTDVLPMIESATDWFLTIQNSDGGWGADSGIGSSIEETGLTIEALCGVALVMQQAKNFTHVERMQSAIQRGLDYLTEQTSNGTSFPASPIGFYFAKLWYFEKLYPIVFALAAFEAADRLERQFENRNTDRDGADSR
jgi:squalene-hopene/tetraprenyl-beta-curcumene cyclase